MLKNMRAAYREGRLAQEHKLHINACRKGLKRAGPNAEVITAKVSSVEAKVLTRCGWTQADRSHTYAGGTGSDWTDRYLMTLPREQAMRATLEGSSSTL